MFRTLVGKFVAGLAILSAPAATVDETSSQPVGVAKTTLVGGIWETGSAGATDFHFMVVYASSPNKYRSVKVSISKSTKIEVAKAVRYQWNNQFEDVLRMDLCPDNEHIFKMTPMGPQEVKDIVIIDKYGRAHKLATGEPADLSDGLKVRLRMGDCP